MKHLVLALTSLLAAGCSSTDTAAGLLAPEFHVRVLNVPEARPGSVTVFSSLVEVDILNRSSEEIKVNRIQISSMGSGRYSIPPVTENFNRTIAAGAFDSFQVRVQVVVEPTLTGADEPVLIRGFADFQSPGGGFRRSFVQRVNPSTLERPPRG